MPLIATKAAAAGAAMLAAIGSQTSADTTETPCPAEVLSTTAAVADLVEANFFDASEAARIAAHLRSDETRALVCERAFGEQTAQVLTEILREEDRHFSVRFVGDEDQSAGGRMMRRMRMPGDGGPTDAMRRSNFGFQAVEILPGNVGYLKLDQFYWLPHALRSATTALEFLADTDAMILDLRNNTGGSGDTANYLMSHFLEPGGNTLISEYVSRETPYPNQQWSLAAHPVGHRPDVPLFILTNGGTVSVAEATAYHLSALDRATIVGSQSRGAGNPGRFFSTVDGFQVFISTARSRSPITQTNWEGVGVQPDVTSPDSTAQDHAHLLSLQAIQESEIEADHASEIAWLTATLQARTDAPSVSPAELSALEGRFGSRRIWMEDGVLFYQLDERPTQRLRPLGANRFSFFNDDTVHVSFELDRRGRAQTVTVATIDGWSESIDRSE